MTMRVGINGFGRTGRQFLRAWWERNRETSRSSRSNGRSPVEMHTHLLRYDSDYGRFPAEVTDGDGCFFIEGHEVRVFEGSEPRHHRLGVRRRRRGRRVERGVATATARRCTSATA